MTVTKRERERGEEEEEASNNKRQVTATLKNNKKEEEPKAWEVRGELTWDPDTKKWISPSTSFVRPDGCNWDPIICEWVEDFKNAAEEEELGGGGGGFGEQEDSSDSDDDDLYEMQLIHRLSTATYKPKYP